MKYDITITFTDEKKQIHAILTMNEYLDLRQKIAQGESFVTVTNTDGYIRTFQSNSIDELLAKPINE